MAYSLLCKIGRYSENGDDGFTQSVSRYCGLKMEPQPDGSHAILIRTDPVALPNLPSPANKEHHRVTAVQKHGVLSSGPHQLVTNDIQLQWRRRSVRVDQQQQELLVGRNSD